MRKKSKYTYGGKIKELDYVPGLSTTFNAPKRNALSALDERALAIEMGGLDYVPSLGEREQMGKPAMDMVDMPHSASDFVEKGGAFNRLASRFGTGSYSGKEPRMGEGAQHDLNALDVGRLLVDIAGPTADLLARRGRVKELREKSEVDFDPLELKKPAIRSARRPNLAMPNRPSNQATAQGQLAEQSFKDAQLTANTNRFNEFDENFRYQQERLGDQVENQERMVNAQFDAREKSMNAMNSLRELLGHQLPSNESSVESLFANTSNDLTQLSALKGYGESDRAKFIVENPGLFDEGDVLMAKNFITGKSKFKNNTRR